MLNSSRNRKLVIGLMFVMMGGRFLVFGLTAAGLINWGGSSLGLSLFMPVGMAIVMILFVVLLGPGRMMRQHVSADGGRPSPLEVLQTRFARGEITREQYEEMKQVLEHDAPADSTGAGDQQRLPTADRSEDGRHRP